MPPQAQIIEPILSSKLSVFNVSCVRMKTRISLWQVNETSKDFPPVW